jgi:hypothetical protein
MHSRFPALFALIGTLASLASAFAGELRLLQPGAVVESGKDTLVCTSGSDKKVSVKFRCEKKDPYAGLIGFDTSEEVDPAVANDSSLLKTVLTSVCRKKYGWSAPNGEAVNISR